jgi:hypothetical protein
MSILLALTGGCAAMRTIGIYNPPPSVPAPVPVGYPSAIPSSYQLKIMICGGDGHKTYLGCLNCSELAADSVKNQFGQHGSPYSSESLFNHFSQFGSLYSTWSACNPYATNPPVIVDGSGKFYGRLTLNTFNSELGAGNGLAESSLFLEVTGGTCTEPSFVRFFARKSRRA